MLTENEIASHTLTAAIKVHRALGPGLYESVYERCLAFELEELGLSVKCQVQLPVTYRGLKFERGFVIDMLVEDLVIIELKSVGELLPIHYTQVNTYLKLADKRLGLLINFHKQKLADGFKRVAHRMPA